MTSKLDTVERVARAMKAKLSSDESDVYFRDGGGTCVVDGHVDMDALARAAIEAMRMPTKEMRRAGYTTDAFRTPDDMPDERNFEAGAVWRAMIDAALNPSPSAADQAAGLRAATIRKLMESSDGP